MGDNGARFANFSVNQRWPNHINIDVFRQTLCQASDGDLFLRCNELQERYSRLNCAIREGKALKVELTRRCSDHIQHLEVFEEEIRHLEAAAHDKQIKMEENQHTATQYSCEAALLMNQAAPKLPPVAEETAIAGDLAKLSDQIFEMYAALLVLRAGEIILFEDMKSKLEKRPACTRNVKHQVKELRKKIREYEHTILNLTNEQKKWKGTLKAGKLNICRRARQQHNGLKEEAGKLKRTIDLFNEEKEKLAVIARNLEDSLNTTLGEHELAELMEHFEPLVDPNNQIHTAGEQPGANLRNMFKPKPAVSTMSGMRRVSGVAATSVEQADKVNQLQKLWLDSVATKVKMDGNIIRANFDIELLEAALTAESYYDNKRPECERKRIVRTIVHSVASDELMGFKDADLGEYFDPDVKFPGRNRCLEVN
ncbi:uncharacterized protein LOC129586967 [Paramacrobiotus metropolitanus]|uniref:uncharacterized protein LOC129586967 n=1 Tax=Paramacrobiotus metropolitanus TaxID=2943436 RepID=UPI002445A2B8|nr:uncharacterized protein LOC129586967 [Paramacrobiotus metropolitanus]